nr:hypothetical protein [Tanacetum cinerariifolium]
MSDAQSQNDATNMMTNDDIDADKVSNNESEPEPPMKNKEVIGTILDVIQPEMIAIYNPNFSFKKGGVGGKKRMIILKDQEIATSQKTNARRCYYCGEYGTHDSRNCPVKKKKLEAQKKSKAKKKSVYMWSKRLKCYVTLLSY